MFQGRIVKALSGFYYVEDNDNIIECQWQEVNFVKMK